MTDRSFTLSIQRGNVAPIVGLSRSTLSFLHLEERNEVGLTVSLIAAKRVLASSTGVQSVEVFYNKKRLHSALDYASPVDYEQHAALLKAA